MFIAVDQKPTNGRHFVGVYAMDPEWIEAGRRLCDDVLAGWLEAQERGEYPDECTGLMELEGPTWSLLQTPNVRPTKAREEEPNSLEGMDQWRPRASGKQIDLSAVDTAGTEPTRAQARRSEGPKEPTVGAAFNLTDWLQSLDQKSINTMLKVAGRAEVKYDRTTGDFIATTLRA